MRGQLFTKLSRDVYQAAKEGGGNPDVNFRLRVAIERARQSNLPMDSITRTIAKATGSLPGVTYEELVYEGYGPSGVAILLEIVTDNRNRTAADVRHIFGKRGGNLGETGCVAWMFRRVGRMTVAKAGVHLAADEVLLQSLEAGAEDVRENEDEFEIIAPADEFTVVRDALEAAGFTLDDAELTYLPTVTVPVSDEVGETILDLVEALEEHDDIQTVHTNVV